MESLTFDTDVQFHLLRHFSKLDKNYIKQFSGISGYSISVIEEQLKINGSKFHYNFAADPQALCNILNIQIANDDHSITNLIERKVIRFQFDNVTYPNGIGTNNLISIENLSPVQRQRAKEEIRGGHKIMVLDDIPPQLTWEVHVILHEKIDYGISTIFPGIYAPPFPDKEIQSGSELSISESFWNNYVVIGN